MVRLLPVVTGRPLTLSLEILTPADPRLCGGITSFRIEGLTSGAENAAIARRLLADHRIFTVHRTGPARGACVTAPMR